MRVGTSEAITNFYYREGLTWSPDSWRFSSRVERGPDVVEKESRGMDGGKEENRREETGSKRRKEEDDGVDYLGGEIVC